MSAYWIGLAKVRDTDAMRRYGELAGRTASIHPGQQIVVRGGAYRVLEGSGDFDRHVILRFGSMEEALRYYHSPECQAAAAIRQAACERCELLITEDANY